MPALSNAQIAERLTVLAQLLSAQKENPFKVKAYRRAARMIAALGESIEERVQSGADLTEYAGVGKAIEGAIREIVRSGTMGKLERLRAEVSPELAAITEYPRLDPKRVLRIYKKLKIGSVPELKERLESGEIAATLGARMAQHVQQALEETHEILLYEANRVASAVEKFLRDESGAVRTELAGEYRRKIEVVKELSVLIETDDFARLLSRLEHYGGRSDLITAGEDTARFRLASGIALNVVRAKRDNWGGALIHATGSEDHVRMLAARGALQGAEEVDVYRNLGLSYIEPELRWGRDEIELAAQGRLPVLVSTADIRGELHSHSTASDGSNTIEEMARGAEARGYEYLGITDHSQSLKIARGVSQEDLWKQIRFIDRFNETSSGIRVLKSAEVDILADGSLDYPDELLRELDYTVCSIHSRFGFGKAEQTARILRAMDNRYFKILGHATGRLLLKRPGYEIDIERVIEHAKANGCCFEINSSPDRLDLSAEHARMARDAGVKIAISTDAHAIREFGYIKGGIEQARRAGLDRASVLNCLALGELIGLLKRS